jgi:hypothetical protein
MHHHHIVKAAGRPLEQSLEQVTLVIEADDE